MVAALSKSEIEHGLAQRFGSAFKLREDLSAVAMTTGVNEVDRITGGLPRGAITEILGPASSGRTSFLHSVLSASTINKEVCALVDASDSFDATSAARAGTDLDQLLWIRCSANVDHAIKATDLLLQSGGFGLVALDLGDIPARQSRRVQLSWWFRFKKAIEKTPTALIVISQDPNARSCATLVLGFYRKSAEWSNAITSHNGNKGSFPTCSNLLNGFRLQIERRKPMCLDEQKTCFETRSWYCKNSK